MCGEDYLFESHRAKSSINWGNEQRWVLPVQCSENASIDRRNTTQSTTITEKSPSTMRGGMATTGTLVEVCNQRDLHIIGKLNEDSLVFMFRRVGSRYSVPPIVEPMSKRIQVVKNCSIQLPES